MRVVPAVNSADSATPASTMLSGVISRRRESPRITVVESMAPANAQAAVMTGLTEEVAPSKAAAPLSAIRMMATDAPNAAPWATPSVLAEARGLRSTLWNAQPESESAMPATSAVRMRGRRMFTMTAVV